MFDLAPASLATSCSCSGTIVGVWPISPGISELQLRREVSRRDGSSVRDLFVLCPARLLSPAITAARRVDLEIDTIAEGPTVVDNGALAIASTLLVRSIRSVL